MATLKKELHTHTHAHELQIWFSRICRFISAQSYERVYLDLVWGEHLFWTWPSHLLMRGNWISFWDGSMEWKHLRLWVCKMDFNFTISFLYLLYLNVKQKSIMPGVSSQHLSCAGGAIGLHHIARPEQPDRSLEWGLGKFVERFPPIKIYRTSIRRLGYFLVYTYILYYTIILYIAQV